MQNSCREFWMFSTLFPPPQKTPTSRTANPRGAQGGRLRTRHTRAVSLNDLDGPSACAQEWRRIDFIWMYVTILLLQNLEAREREREALSDIVCSSFSPVWIGNGKWQLLDNMNNVSRTAKKEQLDTGICVIWTRLRFKRFVWVHFILNLSASPISCAYWTSKLFLKIGMSVYRTNISLRDASRALAK